MIYELRLYSVVPGRLDVCYERFEKHLPALFKRHGIRNVGRWTATAGPNGPMFVYAMAYRDLAERETQWNGFYRDPDWAVIRSRTQGDEEAVERFDLYFLKPNPSWIAPALRSDALIGGVHDLILWEIALGKNAIANAFLADPYLPTLTKAGAEIMLMADFISGPALPRLALMIAWPDANTRTSGWRAVNADAGLKEAFATQRRRVGRAALGRSETYLLEPTSFALPMVTLGNPIEETG